MGEETKGTESFVRVNIRVSPEVHQYYKSRAEQSGASMSTLMFLALETSVQQQKMMDGGFQQLIQLAKSQGML